MIELLDFYGKVIARIDGDIIKDFYNQNEYLLTSDDVRDWHTRIVIYKRRGDSLHDIGGRLVYRFDGKLFKNFYGETLFRFENNNIKEFVGGTIYKIRGNPTTWQVAVLIALYVARKN